MPTYFAGTNCRVFMTVGTTPEGLKRVEFKIGGELVWEADYPNPSLPPYVVTVSSQKGVMFDSTRFGNGNLTVSVEIWGWSGAHRSFSAQAPVKNNALLYGRMELEQSLNDMDHGVPSGVDTLDPLNYGLYPATNWPWTWAAMRADLMYCNVFYVNTHGNANAPFRFLTDRDEADPPVTERVYPWNVNDATYNIEDALHEKVGTGTPPFNSNQPPFNLVWIDACNTGQDNEFAEAFLWPYVNAYGGWCENQSQLGYRIQALAFVASATTSAFWEALADGESAYSARIALHSACAGIDPTCPQYPSELIALWGDFSTRLHHVYLENNGVQLTDFCRSL